jgi:hypothetical protein
MVRSNGSRHSSISIERNSSFPSIGGQFAGRNALKLTDVNGFAALIAKQTQTSRGT